MKKKILIFAHYYYPDVASTAQILKDQAEGLCNEFDVTVICVIPSYSGIVEDRYKTNKFYKENLNGVSLIRIRVPEFIKTNKMSRIKNILVYFWGALIACKNSGQQDYIFTISQPPILGGLLGVIGKWIKKAKLIYCIQDFNPEQAVAIKYFSSNFLIKVMYALDKFSCKHSDLIITVGRDLIKTLENRFNGKIIPNHIMINNWIDEKEIYPLPPENHKVQSFRKKYGLENKFVIMYSGNIGLYYDLVNILMVIEKFKEALTPEGKQVVFAFVGQGTVLDKLVLYKEKRQLDNVIFIPYQDKSNLIYSLNAGDVHWCINAKGIKGISCPSKFYGIIAIAKPVLGVLEKGSEVQMLIEETGCGYCSEPEDYAHIQRNIQWFIENAGSPELTEMGQKGHRYLLEYLTKDRSIKEYIKAIKAL